MASSSSSSSTGTGELWSQILRESSRQTSQLPCTHLVLLGDRNCGKTSLLIKLQQRQDQAEQLTKGVALDYSFLEVLDDDSDDVLGRINVWQLEGERQHIDLLTFAVNATNIHHTVALVALDLSEPWNLDKCLTEWLACIREHVQSLRLPTAALQALRDANEKRFTSYTEPVLSSTKKLKASFLQISKRKVDNDDDDDASAAAAASAGASNDAASAKQSLTVEEIVDKSDELPTGVLNENWGIPIIVVGCKSDVLLGAPGQRYHYTDDQVDYIQQHLRRICLAHGASLLFTSSTRETNCTVLQDLIEHLLYGFDFVHPPQVVDKGALFIPFGWDSLEKIQLDFDTQRACSDPSIPYDQVIKKPSALDRGVQIDMEHVEEYQEFLARHKHTLEKRDFAKAATSGQASDATSPRAPVSSAAATPASPAVEASQNLFLDLGIGGGATPSSSLASPSAAIPNSDAIHNFFQSLLEGSSQDAAADRVLQSQLDELNSPSQK